MARYTTVALAEAALARTETAIARIEAVGQSHANNSGGSSRATTEADLEKLEKRARGICRAIRGMQGGGVSSQRSAW